MAKILLDCESLLLVDNQHSIDEVQGRIPAAVSIRRRVVEAAGPDLLRESKRNLCRIQLIGEGSEAAQADVEDYAA